MRMREAAEYARKTGADYFTTTLSISPLKNADKINEIGKNLKQNTASDTCLRILKRRKATSNP